MIKPPTGAFMSQGEGDRTPEFKERRGKIVRDVNDWLEMLAAKRDNHEPLANGMTLMDQSLITQTNMGRLSPGIYTSEERTPGTSLIGDGETTPFVFQKVEKTGDGFEIVTVQGSDPIVSAVRAGEYVSAAKTEIVASFGSRTKAGDEQQYFQYEVKGDGQVNRLFKDDRGFNVTAPVSRAEDLGLAQQAFDHIKASAQI